ncbi:MAG: hypothetical protein BWK68_00700 [Elusimicrobia bacterium A5]|nr:MAG: hypothetical protein BWK68_00700 [Elusimicrobia bacterium A5]
MLSKIKKADYGDFESRCRRCFIAVIFIFISVIISAEGKKLPAEEKLVYDLYWKFVKVGYGTLEIKGIVDYRGKKAYHIYSEAKSAPFFDVFFKVRDFTNSWVDAEKFRSIAFEQHISEGRYKRDKRTDYDQEKHLATNNKGETFEIPENVLDVLAALYWVRLQEIKPKDIFTLSVNSNKKNYKMKIMTHGREKIKISGKKYKTIIVEPDLQDAGLFMQKGKVLIWLTDDEHHIPVKMRSEIAVGSIVAELNTEEKNVKP